MQRYWTCPKCGEKLLVTVVEKLQHEQQCSIDIEQSSHGKYGFWFNFCYKAECYFVPVRLKMSGKNATGSVTFEIPITKCLVEFTRAWLFSSYHF